MHAEKQIDSNETKIHASTTTNDAGAFGLASRCEFSQCQGGPSAMGCRVWGSVWVPWNFRSFQNLRRYCRMRWIIDPFQSISVAVVSSWSLGVLRPKPLSQWLVCFTPVLLAYVVPRFWFAMKTLRSDGFSLINWCPSLICALDVIIAAPHEMSLGMFSPLVPLPYVQLTWWHCISALSPFWFLQDGVLHAKGEASWVWTYVVSMPGFWLLILHILSFDVQKSLAFLVCQFLKIHLVDLHCLRGCAMSAARKRRPPSGCAIWAWQWIPKVGPARPGHFPMVSSEIAG